MIVLTNTDDRQTLVGQNCICRLAQMYPTAIADLAQLTCVVANEATACYRGQLLVSYSCLDS
jgi:hypothetical protein